MSFGVLCVVLATAAVCDVRSGRVPNALTHGAMLLGLGMGAVMGAMTGDGALKGLYASGLGLAAGLLPLTVLYALGGLGGGDVKLMGAVGAISADWHVVFDTAVYGFVLAALLAVVIMVRHRIVGRTLRRIFSAVLFFLARVTPDMPTDSPGVPFALAIAVGGILAGAQHLLKLPLPWSL